LKKEDFSPGLTAILVEMCKRVGANFDDLNFQEDGWYNLYTWSAEEQLDFEKWIINHPDKKVIEVLGHYKNKKDKQTKASLFTLWYGWKLNNEELPNLENKKTN
jgi:hypothetical protein